jgi:phosphatidylinositol alpha-1,6-mannosyltransferase
MLSKIFRYRVFITCHGLDILEPLKSRVHKFLMKIVLNRADAIFCVSSYTKSLLFKYVKLKKNNNVYIVNNGINSKKFYIMYDDKKKDNFFLKYKDKFVLLTISRLTPRKGHLTVLKSLIKLKQYIPNIYYLVVGRGETDSVIQQFMKKNGLENYVELCGFVSDDKLIEYYNSANIFVMLSEEIIETGDVEGFGVSYIEANACGVPAIGKNCGGAIDAIKNDINGYLVEDEVEFIEKVLFLYKNKKIYENMKISSYNFVKNNFEWQKQTTKIRNLIEQHS